MQVHRDTEEPLSYQDAFRSFGVIDAARCTQAHEATTRVGGQMATERGQGIVGGWNTWESMGVCQTNPHIQFHRRLLNFSVTEPDGCGEKHASRRQLGGGANNSKPPWAWTPLWKRVKPCSKRRVACIDLFWSVASLL